MTIDAHGNLFGTTYGGGAGGGTVWEIAKGSSTLTALADFNITNGIESYGNVTIDAHGNLLGTTAFGGASNAGKVWEIAKGRVPAPPSPPSTALTMETILLVT